MSKKIVRLLSIFTILAMSISLLAGCEAGKKTSAESDVIIVKVADNLTHKHYFYTHVIKPWMDRVTELTDGKVQFEYYNGEQLGKSKEVYKLVKAGVADMGYIIYASDVIPFLEIPQLPGLYTNAEEGSLAFWEFSKGYMMENGFEKAGVRPMVAVTVSPYTLITHDGLKIESLEDIKGKKFRAEVGGPFELTLKEFGAVPISLPSVEFMESMQRKSIDGSMAYWGQIDGFQWGSVAQYFVRNLHMNGYGVVYAMNDKSFQSYPKEVQEAMLQAGEETVQYYVKEHAALEDAAWKRVEEDFDGVLYDLDAEEVKKINEKFNIVREGWIERNEKRNLPAREAIDEYKKLVEKYRKVLSESKK